MSQVLWQNCAGRCRVDKEGCSLTKPPRKKGETLIRKDITHIETFEQGMSTLYLIIGNLC